MAACFVGLLLAAFGTDTETALWVGLGAGFVCFLAAWGIDRERTRHAGALFSSNANQDFFVEIIKESASNLNYAVLAVEVKVRITNQTDSPQSLGGFGFMHQAGPNAWEFRLSGNEANEVRRRVAQMQAGHPELRVHSRIDPGDSVVGWLVIPLTRSGTGIPAYRLLIHDAAGREFAVDVPAH